MPQPRSMENSTAPQVHFLTRSPEILRAEADALACEEAPRRFAVFALDYDEHDGVIVAWGQHFEDGHVVLTGDAVPVRGTFASLRSALRVCGHEGTATHVAWVDPEPALDVTASEEPAVSALGRLPRDLEHQAQGTGAPGVFLL